MPVVVVDIAVVVLVVAVLVVAVVDVLVVDSGSVVDELAGALVGGSVAAGADGSS